MYVKQQENFGRLRNHKWVGVEDWSSLVGTSLCYDGVRRIEVDDVENFVENIFRDIARQTGYEYNAISFMLKSENIAFYKSLRRLFASADVFSKEEAELKEVLELLRIPDIEKCKLTAETVVADFHSLPKEEKIKVLEALDLIRVEVKPYRKIN